MVAICLTAGAARAQEATPTPSPVEGTIASVKFTGLHAIDEDIARDVVSLQPGEPFTRDKLENTINALKDWGVFAEVTVLVAFEGNKVDIVYELKEGFIIKDISIDGNYPLLESVVRRALFLNPGQIYDSSRLPEQVDRLDKLYDKEGYFQSTVLAIEEYDEEKREVTLRFKIQKGRTYKVRDVNVTGNTVFEPKKVRSIIVTLGHYKPRKNRKNMEKLQNKYVKKGYVRARVKLAGEHYDYDARKVDLDIAVRQGKRVFVGFQGNDHFRLKTLRKQITIYEDGDYDEYELEASKKKLLTFYQLHGFENAQVDYLKQKLDDENFLITFRINEGLRTRVKDIEFKGDDEIDTGKLKEIMITKTEGLFEKGYYLKSMVDQDMKLIDAYFKTEGWLDSAVESWEKDYNEYGDKVIVTVNLLEKPRAQVNELSFEGLNDEEKEEIFSDLLLQPGRPYSLTKLDQDSQAVLLMLANMGYPYAQIHPETNNIRDNLWDVKLKVDRGELVRIGHVLFVGNSLTKEKILRQNMRFKEGDKFSAKNILSSQINLRRLGIFDAVGIEALGLANREKVVQAVVRVQEKKNKIIDLQVGYSTDSGVQGQLIFNKLNMWGLGKNGNIKLQGGQEVSRFEVNYIDPRLRGTGLQLVIGAFAAYENRPFFENFGTGVYSTVYKDITDHLSAYARLEFEYVNFNETNTVISVLRPPEATQDRTRLKTTLGTIYDRRNNFGRPTGGYYLSADFTLTNQFIQRSGNYVTLHGSAGYWYTPFPILTIANALRVADIIPIPGDTNVPVDDRLYLGGDDTVRGYEQDSILPTGGLFSLVHNLELQFNLFKNFQFVGFLDTGMDVNNISQASFSSLRFGAGPGVRYLTPVGPIRLEYGFKLNPQPGDSIGRLHFSFGYFF